MADLGRFRALVAEEPKQPARFVEIGAEDLGEGDVVVRVTHSGINYKDALAATATAPIVRSYPLVIGIDLAGEVVECGTDEFLPGDRVLVAGAGLSEDHPGGYSEFARIPAAWCVKIPELLDARSAMALGTAGLTAMLCCFALERNGSTVDAVGDRPVIVTGAAGGVGSFAVSLLSTLGYRVVASTGRIEETPYLEHLGASEVVSRELLAPSGKGPLGSAEFGAAIDVVGGATLPELLRRTAPNGTVAACGHAGGAELSTTVYPFILRGVVLAGVNSIFVERGERDRAWRRLAELIPADLPEMISTLEPLDRVPELAPLVLAGKIRGHVVVEVGPGA